MRDLNRAQLLWIPTSTRAVRKVLVVSTAVCRSISEPCDREKPELQCRFPKTDIRYGLMGDSSAVVSRTEPTLRIAIHLTGLHDETRQPHLDAPTSFLKEGKISNDYPRGQGLNLACEKNGSRGSRVRGRGRMAAVMMRVSGAPPCAIDQRVSLPLPISCMR